MRFVCFFTALVIVAIAPARASTAPPPIGHVFVIVLENKGFNETFIANPPSELAYLARDLPAQGALLRQYYATGHVSLDNYISMVSGQAPNVETQSDCQMYTDFVGVIDPSSGQAIGQGCVYSRGVQTIVDQLEAAANATWKGYMEDMGNDLGRDGRATCAHPPLNSRDGTQAAEVGDQYATRHNPFVFFHSIIDDPARCDSHVVPLGDDDTTHPGLASDLTRAATTPNFVFITPNLCNDAHDAACVDGQPGGLVSANQFLETWVPRITDSPAYRRDGLLIITFDEADVSPNDPEAATSCCEEPTGFNTPLPGIWGPGGGRTGTVALSRFIAPGTTSDTPYNHYSLLRSLEDIFGVGHLGYAAQEGLAPFGSDVYTNPSGRRPKRRP